MRKMITGMLLAFTTIMTTSTINAQSCSVPQKQKITNFKKGNNVIEVGLLQGNNTGLLSNKDGYIRHKVFLSNQVALRTGVALSGNVNTTNPYHSENLVTSITTSRTSVGLSIGLEKRFAETNRLSPYFGADFMYSNSSMSNKGDNLNLNGMFAPTNSYKLTQSYGTIGAKGFIGADYFITKSIFIGAEIGIGFNTSIYNNSKYSVTYNGQTSNNEHKQNKITDFGTLFTGAKIGFKF